MLHGELYDPTDPELVAARLRSQRVCRQYNETDPGEIAMRQELLCDLFASFGDKSESWLLFTAITAVIFAQAPAYF